MLPPYARALVAVTLALPAAVAATGASKLALAKVNLHQYEDGPAIGPGHEYFPGETVFLSFHISGYKLSEKDRVLLGYRIEPSDPAGIPIAKPADGRIDEQLTFQDKKQEWMPKVRYHVMVPPFAPSGDYRLQVAVKDLLAETETRQEITVTVRGHDVEASPVLTVRNFRFLRTDQDGDPLNPAAYRPGDTVWARFEITGYRFGDNNRFHVEYGIGAERENGEVLFSQPKAAEEAAESFYPKRYQPGILSLNLTPDLAPGPYTIVLSVRDIGGNQTYETRRVFRVE